MKKTGGDYVQYYATPDVVDAALFKCPSSTASFGHPTDGVEVGLRLTAIIQTLYIFGSLAMLQTLPATVLHAPGIPHYTALYCI